MVLYLKMANLKHLKDKINSTKKTKATTKAMKMVSAAKLRKAQGNIINQRPYAKKLLSVIADLKSDPNLSHPFIKRASDEGKNLFVVLTSDRGLCGGFNNNICKYTSKALEKEPADLICIGKRGQAYFQKRQVVQKHSVINLDRNISYKVASDISKTILEFYQSGEYERVKIIYNDFKSVMTQVVTQETLLPLEPSKEYKATDFIFEPHSSEILDTLLRKNFVIQIYRCFQESVASEHGARMTAMENATKNADEMIDKLSLDYNKQRQEKITTELIEITSGSEAL